ncbi:MAG: hypothetical protein JW750_02300 [Anaerolineaceae bacterium]|nr:hypothetical protein [Anaerolineaceae bacterium]
MYNYDYFVENGILRQYPERDVPEPPQPELYHLAEDPLEQHNVADQYPNLVSRMLTDLETWFEEVEAERQKIDDRW